MRLPGIAVATVMMTAAVGLAAQEKSGVAGAWTVTVKGQGAHGDMTAGLTLKQDGARVTGTMTAHGNEMAVSGELTGRDLTLNTNDTGDAQITLHATVKDDGTLDGYLSGPMGDMRFTAVRSGGK